MIRVAQIMGKWVGGGVESVIMNYYRHIDRTKIQFDFICDEDSTNIPYDEIASLGGRVFVVPPYQHLHAYNKALHKLFEENKYKIIHSNINTLSVFPLKIAKKCGIPIRIAHSHSTSNKKEWKKNILKNILRPFSKKYANVYFACSELAARYLFGDQFYDDKKITIINNAIDVDKFKYNKEIRDKIRKELKIEDNTLVLGHVGRFVEQKNHTFLIDIFNELHKQNPNSKLLLIGQGPLQREIQIKVNNLKLNKAVIFLNQRSDVNNLYQAMDVFLLPSLYEGLPVSGVEAQTAGLLFVLSNKITSSAKMLDSTTYIDLNKTANYWSNKILELYSNYIRKDTTDIITDFGFNIEKEAHKLEKKYFELMKAVGEE